MTTKMCDEKEEEGSRITVESIHLYYFFWGEWFAGDCRLYLPHALPLLLSEITKKNAFASIAFMVE